MGRRIAHAEWTGELSTGTGGVSIGGERLGLAYTPAWLQEGAGTNPEELLAAAHAASFAMALQVAFSAAHQPAEVVRVRAELHVDRRKGEWTITRSDLEAEIGLEENRTSDIPHSEFRHIVEDAAANCPVSRALAGVEITVNADLVKRAASRWSSRRPRPACPGRPAGEPHACESTPASRAGGGRRGAREQLPVDQGGSPVVRPNVPSALAPTAQPRATALRSRLGDWSRSGRGNVSVRAGRGP